MGTEKLKNWYIVIIWILNNVFKLIIQSKAIGHIEVRPDR